MMFAPLSNFDFVSVCKASKMVGIDPLTVFRAIADGRIPACRTDMKKSLKIKAVDLAKLKCEVHP